MAEVAGLVAHSFGEEGVDRHVELWKKGEKVFCRQTLLEGATKKVMRASLEGLDFGLVSGFRLFSLSVQCLRPLGCCPLCYASIFHLE